MKTEYTLLKRSKVDSDRYAFVHEGNVVRQFDISFLHEALEKVSKGNAINDVDVLWRNGTRTVEQLIVKRERHFVRFDLVESIYTLCLMLRAQGLPVEFNTPVDIRDMYDAGGAFIKEIRIPCEVASGLIAYISSAMLAEEHLADDDYDVDFDDDDDYNEDTFGMSPEDQRLQVSDWGYRSADWSVSLTDDQISKIHSLEVGLDSDIELPLAEDAKEEFF